MKRTTIRLPDELLRRAKSRASAEGRSLTSLVEEGLHLILASPVRAKRREVKLPLSRSTGGLQEGVNLSSNKDVLGLMDAE